MVVPEKALHTKAIILLFCAAVLWSFGGLLVKSIQWNPMAIAGMRSAIAIFILLFVIKKGQLKYSAPEIVGAFFYSATVILYVCANKLTAAANVILLQYTAPIHVAVFGIWLLKEKVNKYDWIVIFIALSGMVLFLLVNSRRDICSAMC